MSTNRPLAFVNARLIDPASRLDAMGGLIVEGARIAAVTPGLAAKDVPEGAEIIDCAGHVLAPGLIDMHVFTGEPGEDHKETLASAGRAAAAGGVTTIIVMPDTRPVLDDVALIEYVVRRGAETSPVHVHPMAAATRGLAGEVLTEMGLLGEAGAVAFTDARRAIPHAATMYRALCYATTFGHLIVQHAEEPTLAEGGCVNEGEMATRLGLPGILRAAESMVIDRDVRLVAATGARYHVAQVSCADSIEVVAGAKAAGLAVTCGAAVAHFALNETAIGDYRTFAKTSPPLRAEEDRQAVVQGLADSTIDVIVSGHDPQDQESKRLPFAQAAAGIIGLETLLPLALELHHNGSVELMRLLEAMTAAPARLLGLEAGRLAPGAPADLVLFDLDHPWRIDVDAFASKSKNSPFDGRPVQGKVLRTLVAGRTVFEAA